MTIQQKLYTAKEFWATVDERSADKLYELIHGEIFEMAPPKKSNSIIAAYIARLIGNFVEANQIDGYVLGRMVAIHSHLKMCVCQMFLSFSRSACQMLMIPKA